MALCPALGVYAAIRMDPVAMVAHLDERAAEEARELCPKTYLIFTAFSLSSPFPGRTPWYAYHVRSVGPSLRAVDEKRGFESHMCVPIFPNETHPAGRAPARPSSAFPYDNCYHWAAMDLDVRVHPREEGFDNKCAIRLPVRERTEMESHFRSDLGSAKRTRLAREAAVSVPCADIPAPPEPSSSPHTAGQPKVVASSHEDDIFEPPEDSEDPEYIPLVHLWLDLTANLKQEDIGNPVDLYRERFAIMSIIRRAHERNEDLPTLREHISAFQLQQDSYICDSDSDSNSCLSGTASEYASEVDESEVVDGGIGKPKRFRPVKLFRKLGSGVRGMFCIRI